ncbi:amino acid/polyamine/organocation transporter, APC superfamily [Syncephalis fuscata]|nr:amino acid/polyamine/organocation transporter, APC superfamily [Syncephalis fuscata]
MAFSDKLRVFGKRLVTKKSLADLAAQARNGDLVRSLGAIQLTGLGIGAIIGTGIFVLTGSAAANYAGPGVIISFVISGLAAAFAALSYSELSSMIPVAGSAYTYTYATMGEFLAWIIGWDLILEYLVGAATVSVGWAAYMVSFLETAQAFEATGDYINLPAVLIVLVITGILVFGIKASARFNAAIVAIKLTVILLFIFACCSKVNTDYYTPFIPPRTDDGKYGGKGIFTASTVVFFAYIGFDAVSTAAQEAKNPQRDMPIGILASLVVCTVLYIAVAAILVGLLPYSELNVAHPLTYAIEKALGWKWLVIIIDIGAIAGLTSVMLILLMGQPRIFYAMASDGLFPKFVAKIHPKYRTPYVTTIITGVICAIAGGVLPIDVLGEMTSIGTLLAFFLVNVGVIILRYTAPDTQRRFKVPGGPFIIPGIGAALSLGLIATATVPTIERLFIWMAIGLIIYFAYGYHNSYINHPERRPADMVGRNSDPFAEIPDDNKAREMHEAELASTAETKY